MRALIYCRVSTEEQAEHGYSLAAQEQICRDQALRDGRIVEKVYTDDGYSAGTLNRPAFLRLLEEIRRGDRVYVWRLDRISRDMEDTMAVLKRFRQAGAELWSVTEGQIDASTAAGILNAGVRAVFNQYERMVIGERTAMGLRRRVLDGRPYSSRPFGFVRDADEWRIDPEEAEIVRLMAKWRLEGAGYHTICRRLDEMGVPPTRGAKLWHSNSVRRILESPIYAGYLRYKGEILGKCIPPILDEETWQRLQALNQARRQTRARERSDYLLGGLVWCSCGYRMGPFHWLHKDKTGNRITYPYYRCYAKRARPSVDHTNSISAPKLERIVLAQLDELAQGGEPPNLVLPPPPRIDVSAKLAALDRELEALEIHLLQGRIAPERFDLHKQRIEQTRQQILAEAAARVDEEAYRKRVMEQIRSLAGNLLEQYESNGPTPELKAAVRLLVERIEVERSKDRRPGAKPKAISIYLRAITESK